MSGVLDQNPDDLTCLEGATIEKVWVKTGNPDEWEMEKVVRLRLRYAKGTVVNGQTHGEYELWQDGEGNGPGYLSFVQEG